MGERDFTGGPAMQECGICSNGPHKVYHVGGPCPHAFPTQAGTVQTYTTFEECLSCADLRTQLDDWQSRCRTATEHCVALGRELDEARAAIKAMCATADLGGFSSEDTEELSRLATDEKGEEDGTTGKD